MAAIAKKKSLQAHHGPEALMKLRRLPASGRLGSQCCFGRKNARHCVDDGADPDRGLDLLAGDTMLAQLGFVRILGGSSGHDV